MLYTMDKSSHGKSQQKKPKEPKSKFKFSNVKPGINR